MICEAIVLKTLVAAFVLMSLGGAAEAATVTLQQGADGYGGCSTRTLWGPGARKPAREGNILYLRGAHNRFVVKFTLPKFSLGGPLARARLGLFLPAARKMNAFTEVFCHEITADGAKPVVDQKTDYDNGRRPGAVDSVELFAPGGRGWNNQPWLPLGIPDGGKWIEFNVTPLVDKWMKDPKSNHGLVIVPADCPDKRLPSTWEINIPSAESDQAAHRPRLTLEFSPPAKPYLVGMTDGMVQILDRSTRFAYRGGYGTEYRMSMAANELEGFQVVVYPMLDDLEQVRFSWTDLKAEGGAKIPAGDIEYFTQEWYKLRATKETDQVLYAGKLYEVPDPLIPGKPVTIRRHMHTPFYFRVRTRPDTPAGVYRGTVSLTADGAAATKLKLTVKVWPFAIPEKWNFHTMGQFIQGTCQKFHGDDWGDALRRKYYDFLMENRFSPTEQYSRILSPRKDLPELLQRGMNTVYLSGNFTGTDDDLARLKSDYEKVKKLAALDYALVYIGDETDKWDEMHRRADLVHAHLPGAMVMIGGSRPRKELVGYVDIYDPLISSASKLYGFTEKEVHQIKAAQQRGEEFYWYVCIAPSYPYPNVMLEYPPVMGRVLFWMTWKYGVTGFEYYCYNIWNKRNFSDDPAKRFPRVKWNADGYERSRPTNGDGMLFYPGPITCLRFEAIRDGVEEWEAHQLLRDCVEAVRHRKHPQKYRALINKAEKLLAVKDEVVASFSKYTTDPERLLAAREELGELLAKAVPAVQDTLKWDAGAMRLGRAAEVRIARQTARRRKMLRQRHLAACEKLKVEPLPQEQWDALWPKRVLFSQDFEGPSQPHRDWDGIIVKDEVASGSKRALAGKTGNKWFARRVRVGMYFDNARAATTTWVRFKYFINKPLPIGVFVFNMTQHDNWEGHIPKPVVDKWTEVTLNVTRDFRKKGGGRAKVKAGDSIDDVFVHAGRPGDKELRLLVDDVQLIGLD